uniref:Uncharacterized protein n=1 Tax=Oryza nivara TaxID=4536 RepID=A0A0E0FK00_ORYNI
MVQRKPKLLECQAGAAVAAAAQGPPSPPCLHRGRRRAGAAVTAVPSTVPSAWPPRRPDREKG